MLEAAGLQCVRQQRTLFTGLGFSLRGGELLRVAGANGSGKTSLLRILCGLLTPEAGEVRWHGAPIHRLREEYARQIVYLGHAPAVKDDLTAAENLSIACTLAGIEAPAQPVHEALARLLLSEGVPLWLLDEPFAALDASAARHTEELIARHVAGGGAVVYTTHQDATIDVKELRVVELG